MTNRRLCAGCGGEIRPEDEIDLGDGEAWHIKNISGVRMSCRPAIQRNRKPWRDPHTGELVVRSDDKRGGSLVLDCQKCGGAVEMRATHLPNAHIRFCFTCLACGDVDSADMPSILAFRMLLGLAS